MKNYFVLLFIFLFCLSFSELKAQAVPASYSWPDFANTSGYDGNRPAHRRCHNFFDVLDELGIPSPPQTNGAYIIFGEIADAIDAVGNQGYVDDTLDVLYFPEGIYQINTMVVIPTNNLVIKGDGAGKTVFNWVGRQQYCFNVIGVDTLDTGGVPVSGMEQDRFFQMPELSFDFQAGDWAVLTRNDPGQGCDSTFVRQFVRIDSFINGTAYFNDPLRIRYDATEDGARVHKLLPLMNVGLEDFSIDASGNAPGERIGSMHSNIAFQFAANCWARGIESYKPAFQHIIVDKASNIEIFGCYFHDSHAFIGGRGYGVNLQNGAAECRVENNIFATLRHAIVVQRGANGNAIAYNYCTDSKDGNGEDDLILHGGYAFRNLVEGNSVEHLHFDLRQCNNGPYNLVFRNRVRKKNIQAGSWPLSAGKQICVVGNESEQCIALIGSSHDTWDNLEYGTLCCCGHGFDDDDDPIGQSILYPGGAPSYLSTTSWPVFGPGKSYDASLPAEKRYQNDIPNTIPSYIFDCNSPLPLSASAIVDPCQVLEGSATRMAGRINLVVEGGIPPYSISWTGEGLFPENSFWALFFESTSWSAVVTDQGGESIVLTGSTEMCSEAITDTAIETVSYGRPLDAVVYPNPTTAASYLRFNLYQSAEVKVEVFASDGGRVWQLDLPGALGAGDHGFEIPSEGWARSLYFVRIRVGEVNRVLRLLVR